MGEGDYYSSLSRVGCFLHIHPYSLLQKNSGKTNYTGVPFSCGRMSALGPDCVKTQITDDILRDKLFIVL
jgi:hypothetical protein